MLALVIVYLAITYKPSSARSGQLNDHEEVSSYDGRESLDD